ncbi:MAG: ABC transporter substrate-binding protein [Phycisphaerae bacterium]|jgi:1,4-dihydroxy-6-naphthoate synthase|nr:ABC transporter substrate-binding protein [Phycisphaerae bacterium]
MTHAITLAHSPDPDDAFMWWPLADIDGSGPAIDTGEFKFELVMKDIETLNAESEQSLYDVTAISIAHYPAVAHLYHLTACGASLGDGYGPKVVSKEKVTMDVLIDSNPTFAVPGERTSALATLRILVGDRPLRWRSVDFTEIMNEVGNGNFGAGVVIHEGQLTYEEHGLFEVCDLGAWWMQRTGLPLPLGGNTIKTDVDERFGIGATDKITSLLLQSIEYAMDHREKSLLWAAKWGRGIDVECTDEFVEMYVNKWTLDFKDRGREAVYRFLSDAAKVGALQEIETITFV